MISLCLIASHMVGDYIAQNDWMAANKLKDWRVRVVHVAAYSACFLPVLAAYAPSPAAAGLFLALNFIAHFVTDSRRWASGDKWPPKPILVDQSIHMATLAILGVIFLEPIR